MSVQYFYIFSGQLFNMYSLRMWHITQASQKFFDVVTRLRFAYRRPQPIRAQLTLFHRTKVVA